MNKYPKVLDEYMVGKYPPIAKSGGGLVWDEVLEYRVWCHPHEGVSDLTEGDDYYYAFVSYEDAIFFAENNQGTEKPIALVLQIEHINEPQPKNYIHVKEERLTEWSVEFLTRPKRTEKTIPDFLSPYAPSNRLEMLRGLV